MKIGCVILSGGKSSRMGRDKAFLEIDGQTFIKQLTDTLDFFDEKMISRNSSEHMNFEGWTIVNDLYKDHGPISGIHACLSYCKSDALFFVTCDMPFIKKSFIDEFCKELDNDVDGIVLKEGNKIHPTIAIYKKEMVKVFENQILSHNNRLLNALEKMNIKYINVDSSKQFQNINTPEDYLTLIKK